MRTTIAIALIDGTWQPVKNLYGNYRDVEMIISDRIANKEAFPHERTVRLPKKRGVNMYRSTFNTSYIQPRYFPDGSRSFNVS